MKEDGKADCQDMLGVIEGVKSLASNSSPEERLIDLFMDVDSDLPVGQRLQLSGISSREAKELVGSPSFDEGLYDECRAFILFPAMAKVLQKLVSKAAGGNTNSIKLYLELMGKIKSKDNINVNMLQYNSLSDKEMDRRIESISKRLGVVDSNEEEEIDMGSIEDVRDVMNE